jgi:hypothetical protein
LSSSIPTTFSIGKTNKPSYKKGARIRSFSTVACTLAARKKTALGKKEPHVKYVGFNVKYSGIAYLRRRTMMLASASIPAISAYELGSGTAVRVMLSIDI